MITKTLTISIFIVLLVSSQFAFAEDVSLSENETEIYEQVIRYHFNSSGVTNQLIGRIGLRDKDPKDSFLDRFSDYQGFFSKISDSQIAANHNNFYYLNLIQIDYITVDQVYVYASDGVIFQISEIRFKLSRNNNEWTVVEAHRIERSE